MMLRKILAPRVLWFGLLLGCTLLVALLLQPLRITAIRLAILSSVAGIWIILLCLVWQHRWLRAVLLVLTALASVALVAPSRSEIDQPKLRRLYIDELRSYDGARYVDGGENHRGIDCSGLVRSGMIDALRKYGLRTLNPAALRASLSLWWRDSNSIDLGNGATGLTTPLENGQYETMASRHDLLPGDLAVTESGSHVLVYSGDRVWIEADPTLNRTHLFQLAGDFLPLGDQRVRFVRWRWLDARSE